MTDSDLERAIADAQLPSAITEKIRRFLSESGLRGEARRELLGELVSHFEEGLASGKRVDELVAAFGDEGHAARLMSRVGPNWEKKMLESPEISARGEGVVAGSLRDARLAVRRLVATPGFTLVAILSLALGIGANTAIFSLVNAVLLRELPLREPERLMDVYISLPDEPYMVFCYPEYRDFVEGTEDVFESVAASRIIFAQVDQGGDVEVALGEAVTGSFFTTLGVRASLGRTLDARDHVSQGAHAVVVLGDAYWRRAFGADPGVIGRSIRLSGRPFTVVGVLDPSYTGSFRGLEPSLYVPILMINQLQPGTRDSIEERGEHALFVKARLRPGVDRVQAEAVAQGVASDLAERRIENWASGAEFLFLATEDVIVYPPFDRFVRAAAWLLVIVAGLVLLLACTNLAGVLLARAVDRRREIAVKLALGASRRSLVRQLVLETVILALVAGVAGLAVAFALLRTLLSADLPLPLPVTLDLRLDGTVLAFSAGISLLAGIFFGIVPALRATDTDVASTLRDETAGGGGAASSRLRGALVVAQVAISLVLVVGAALFLRSMQLLQRLDPGFGNDPSAILTLAIPADRYTPEEGRVFVRTLEERIEQIPGVEAAGLVANLHLNTLSRMSMDVSVDGFEPPEGRDGFSIDKSEADAGFFDAVGIRILSGRNFLDSDDEDAPKVAIVNEAFARRFWKGNAVGRVFRRERSEGEAEPYEVIGVASNASIRQLGETPRPFVYLPFEQSYQSFATIVARTSLDPERTALELLAAARKLDPDAWIFETKTMDRHLAIVRLPAQLGALLVSVFAAVATVLAVIGLYGMVSYAVSQRVREVGIRMALGADVASVVRLLMGGGMKLIGIGALIGIPLALSAAQLLRGLLVGVEPFDPAIFVASVAGLVLVSSLAAYLAARRASGIDPVVALRSE